MTSIAAGVGSRFTRLDLRSGPIGPEVEQSRHRRADKFVFRTDYKASFDLVDIPNAVNLTILDRLIAWLRAGGVVSVTCGDTTSAVYATCCLAPGTEVMKRWITKRYYVDAVGHTIGYREFAGA